MIVLNDVHIQNRDYTVKIRSHHLLPVPRHHTLSRCKVLRREDRRSHDEWDVRAIHIPGLQVAAALVAHEDPVPREVRVLVDREAVAEGTDRLGADGEGASQLTFAVDGELRLVEHRGLEDRGNVGGRDHEVRGTAEGLAMNRVRRVDDRLDEGLVPLTDGAGELRTDGERRVEHDGLTGQLVDELARSAAPVHLSAVRLRHEVVQDLAVDLESNLLREDARQLDLCVHRVVRI